MQGIGHSLGGLNEASENLSGLVSVDSRGREVRGLHARVVENDVLGVTGGCGHNDFVSISARLVFGMGTAVVVPIAIFATHLGIMTRGRDPVRSDGRDWAVVPGDAGVEENSLRPRVLDWVLRVARRARHNGHVSVSAGGGSVFGTTIIIELVPLAAL